MHTLLAWAGVVTGKRSWSGVEDEDEAEEAMEGIT